MAIHGPGERTRYKLVTQDWKTRKGFPEEADWAIGEANYAKGAGSDLCMAGVLHYYYTSLEAVLYNRIHAKIENPRLLEVEIDEEIATDGLKGGCKQMTPIREIPLPNISTEQLAEFVIRLVRELYPDPAFIAWADKWLSGGDRSETAAEAAAWAAEGAAWAVEGAAWAVEGAAWAVEGAAWAAAGAAWAATRAAWAAEGAAEGAARAAAEAARAAARAAAEAAWAVGPEQYRELVVNVMQQMGLEG